MGHFLLLRLHYRSNGKDDIFSDEQWDPGGDEGPQGTGGLPTDTEGKSRCGWGFHPIVYCASSRNQPRIGEAAPGSPLSCWQLTPLACLAMN